MRRDDDVRPDELIQAIRQEPEDTGLKNIPVTPANYTKFKGEESRHLPAGIFWGLGGIAAIFVAGFVFSFYAAKGRVSGAIAVNIGKLRAGVIDLQNFDPQAAGEKFAALAEASSTDLGAALDKLGFFFKGGRDAVGSFTELSRELSVFSGQLAGLQASGFGFLTTGKGERFIGGLNDIRTTIGEVDTTSKKLADAASAIGGFSTVGGGDLYVSLKAQIEGARKFLDAFIPWLSDTKTHHVLVLLGNPSEIRPGGGFTGSYADVAIAGGNIIDIAVHDVADADVALRKKIIPPKPLQLVTANWRPADANWFFDFPTSARKTLEFVEASDLYAKSSTTFDAAIAVSPKVVSDLLALAGPIAIGKPTTTFTSENFLVEIQKIVQKGQATSATYPKKIIGDLADALSLRLASSTEDSRAELARLAAGWVEKKDVMVFFKDAAIGDFLNSFGASGAEYELPQKFNGDYMAVVDANVGGGKSDLYVSSTIIYSAQINPDGTVAAHVTVMRKHNGNKSPYDWYRTTNQDYLQLMVPDATTLANASGGIEKRVAPKTDYGKGGYAADPLVAAIEATEQTIFGFPNVAWHMDFGKKVFTTWLVVKAGSSATAQFDYSHRLFLPPAQGVGYQFVFERQAATARHYQFDINAPLGYVFAENRLPSYEYATEDMPGRVTINLTLTKLSD